MAKSYSDDELDALIHEALQSCRSQADLIAALCRTMDDVPLPAGYRLPSMRKLREWTGLRHHEVYRALGVLATEGQIEQRRGSGTYVCPRKGTARQRSGRQSRIGVVPPVWDPSASHHGVALILNGISAQADVRHRVEIVPPRVTKLPPAEFMAHIRSLNLEGMIWVQPPAAIPPPLVSLADSQTPVVLTGRPYAQLPLPAVTVDNEALGDALVERLRREGRSRLVCMMGTRDDLYGANQLAAIRAALERHGMSLPDANIVTVHLSGIPGFYSINLRDSVLGFLLKHPGFDAVYTLYPDRLDTLVLLHERHQRRCPDDFIHMHFGQLNIWEGQQWPPFPTAILEVPYQAVGRQAVRELEKLMGVEDGQESEDLAPRFIDGVHAHAAL